MGESVARTVLWGVGSTYSLFEGSAISVSFSATRQSPLSKVDYKSKQQDELTGENQTRPDYKTASNEYIIKQSRITSRRINRVGFRASSSPKIRPRLTTRLNRPIRMHR